MQWFMTEPPVLEWLQIFYRVKMSENGKINHHKNKINILIDVLF